MVCKKETIHAYSLFYNIMCITVHVPNFSTFEGQLGCNSASSSVILCNYFPLAIQLIS